MEDGIERRLLLGVDFVEALGDITRTMCVDELGDSGCVQLAARHAQALGNLLCSGEERIWDRDGCLPQILRITLGDEPRRVRDSTGAADSIAILCAITARTAGGSRCHYSPIDEAKFDTGRFGELLEVPFVSRRERDLSRHSHCSNQNVAKLPAPTAC
jgi:hypothetical protein